MLKAVEFTVPHLPADKPRYLMGVGKPDAIVGAVLSGIDMFDCVLPTRSGRNGQAFTWDGTLNLRNACHAEDTGPIDPECRCPACRQTFPVDRTQLGTEITCPNPACNRALRLNPFTLH